MPALAGDGQARLAVLVDPVERAEHLHQDPARGPQFVLADLGEHFAPKLVGDAHDATDDFAPAWGDPVNHPWTTGSLLNYNTEAVIWGA